MEPEKEFHFIIGSDLLPGLRNWDCFEDFNEKFKFIILTRVGYEINEKNYPKNYQKISINENDYSSTDIRNKIKRVKNMTYSTK